MTRSCSTALFLAIVVAVSAVATGAEKTGDAKKHSFLQVGHKYRFVTDEPVFRAEVLDVAGENWILVKNLPARGRPEPSGTASRTWINIAKVNAIQSLSPDAQPGKTGEARRLPFVEVGRRYHFARFSEDEDGVLAKVSNIPNNSWVQVERVRTQADNSTAKPLSSLWLNLDGLGSITEVPERVK